ncbi:unnamed protein product [Bemisia tabaci]|uniref:Uncharacterized protein n=1 Tax=Bemisia tabaci TaxID=7038 RepID=A0A9N9ZZ89_BEMTA|nr:unnamed protein product [Bemisia tabaci]
MTSAKHSRSWAPGFLSPKRPDSTLRSYVNYIHIPKTALKDVGEVRWWLFSKKQCQDENLPPTRGALDPVSLKAHLQASVRHQALKKNPELPPAFDCGWKKTEENFEPIACIRPCVSEVAMELSLHKNVARQLAHVERTI